MGAGTVLSRRVIRWSMGLAVDGAAARPSVLASEGAMAAVVVVIVVMGGGCSGGGGGGGLG